MSPASRETRSSGAARWPSLLSRPLILSPRPSVLNVLPAFSSSGASPNASDQAVDVCPRRGRDGGRGQPSSVVTSKLAGGTPSVRAIRPRAPSSTSAASGTNRWMIGSSRDADIHRGAVVGRGRVVEGALASRDQPTVARDAFSQLVHRILPRRAGDDHRGGHTRVGQWLGNVRVPWLGLCPPRRLVGPLLTPPRPRS